MKNEVKEKWVAALRSGQYAQCKGKLRTAGNAYCCLGVLADVVEPSKWHAQPSQWGEINHEWQDGDTMRNIAAECDVPRRLLCELAKKNDAGESFEAIASYIEDNL